MSPASAEKLQTELGPEEGTAEHKALEREAGFSFRQVLGELMYAYVIARCDIGYAVTFMARYAARPGRAHYQTLKSIA